MQQLSIGGLIEYLRPSSLKSQLRIWTLSKEAVPRSGVQAATHSTSSTQIDTSDQISFRRLQYPPLLGPAQHQNLSPLQFDFQISSDFQI